MALNKVINDANQKFEPVTTETLVFDTVPTEGSFNAVTSDGVAKAIAEGGGGGGDIFVATKGTTSYQDIVAAAGVGKAVVVVDSSDDSQIPLSYIDSSYAHFIKPEITDSEYGMRFRDVAVNTSDQWGTNQTVSNLPSYANPDNGKVLQIVRPGGTGNATPYWMTPSNVPAVTASDDGKVLQATYSGGTGSYSWATPSGGGGGAFYAEYNVTSYADIAAAYAAGKTVVMHDSNSNEIAYLVYIDTASEAATFVYLNIDSAVIYLDRFRVYGSNVWVYDSCISLPYYDASTDEGKILKIVSGVPTWVTP